MNKAMNASLETKAKVYTSVTRYESDLPSVRFPELDEMEYSG